MCRHEKNHMSCQKSPLFCQKSQKSPLFCQKILICRYAVVQKSRMSCKKSPVRRQSRVCTCKAIQRAVYPIYRALYVDAKLRWVRVCVCACVGVRVCACVCMCMRVCAWHGTDLARRFSGIYEFHQKSLSFCQKSLVCRREANGSALYSAKRTLYMNIAWLRKRHRFGAQILGLRVAMSLGLQVCWNAERCCVSICLFKRKETYIKGLFRFSGCMRPCRSFSMCVEL